MHKNGIVKDVDAKEDKVDKKISILKDMIPMLAHSGVMIAKFANKVFKKRAYLIKYGSGVAQSLNDWVGRTLNFDNIYTRNIQVTRILQLLGIFWPLISKKLGGQMPTLPTQ